MPVPTDAVAPLAPVWEVVADRGDVDLLGELARLQEGVGELLLQFDVRLLHRSRPVRVGRQGRLGVGQRDALLLRERLRVLVGAS